VTLDPPFRATVQGAAYDGITGLPVAVLLDNVRSLYNVGAFFRTSDAVRVERLYLAGITAFPPDRRIGKTALGADETVRWERVADPSILVGELRERGYELAAVETSRQSLDLYDWHPRFPLCVVFGHEVDGIRPELLDRMDTHVRIPMLGRKGSLNVATAGGVVLYELLRKFRLLRAADQLSVSREPQA
jgi:tRNA G18 (ribose-2'-O)-methylase SpoU